MTLSTSLLIEVSSIYLFLNFFISFETIFFFSLLSFLYYL